jgi:hypothetical protein
MFSPFKYSGKVLYILVGNKHQGCSGPVVLEQQPSVLFVQGTQQLVCQYDVYLSAHEYYI